jgi:LCP family protein required for cell wall assembly
MKTTRLYSAMLILIGSVLFAAGAYILADIKDDVYNKEDAEIPEITAQINISSIRWEPRANGSFNILFLGGDVVNSNTDAILLVNIEPDTPVVSIMSIPRDTRVIIEGRVRKVNFAYPQGGGKLAVETVEKLLETDIDHYVYMDLSVFRKAIDLLGGVEYYVPQNMDYDDPYQNLHIHLKKGYQLLDGRKAEYLVRYRKGYKNGDIGRIKVQQDFIRELIKQKVTVSNFPRLRKVLVMLFDNLKTDITIDKSLRLLLLADKLSLSNINFFQLPGEVPNGGSWLFIHDKDRAREIVKRYFSKFDTTD